MSNRKDDKEGVVEEVSGSREGGDVQGKYSKENSSQPWNGYYAALQAWTSIDLPVLQKKLDEQGMELKDDQKSSLLSRKELATRTKEFKKYPDEKKLEEIKHLLKQYQHEIDSLTDKKKKVEGHFFEFYRIIAEAPDPKPLLELALDAVVEASEIDGLREEANKLSEQLSKRADYDQLKQRLLSDEQSSAELLASKLLAKEEEMKALFDEKESNWAQREKQLEEQLREAKNKVEEIRLVNEVSELRQNRQIEDTEGSTSSTELEIVSRDAELAKRRVLELEKRNESLRRDLSISKSESERSALREQYKKKISELESENALLVGTLDKYRKDLERVSNEASNKGTLFSNEISHLKAEIKRLNESIQKRGDYDELKNELMLLRQMEFGQDEVDNESNNSVGNVGGCNDIDSLLMKKNKNLSQELVNYRSQRVEFEERIEQLKKELSQVSSELQKSQQVNQSLENDLASFQDAPNSFNDNSSIISGFTRVTSGRGQPAGSVGGQHSSIGEPSSILPIITKQRDRFRSRNNELEEEVRKHHNTIMDMKRQVNNLRRDNEELYERSRYLATMREYSGAGSSFLSGGTSRRILHPKSNAMDLENNPYQKSYESRLHPIEQFRIREQERITSKLSPFERIFISFVRAILATRTTRYLFLLYCFGLHFVVMFVTAYAMNLSTKMMPDVGGTSKVVNPPAKVVENPLSAI